MTRKQTEKKHTQQYYVELSP